MDETEKVYFIKEINRVERYYNMSLCNDDLEIYWALLKMHTLLDVKLAIYDHVCNEDRGVFMPKVADIKREIRKRNSSGVSADAEAFRAWPKVLSEVRRIGSYGTPVFDDEIIIQVLDDMGGWVEVCKWLDADLPWKEKNFSQRYIQYVQFPVKNTKKLTGTIDKQVNKAIEKASLKSIFEGVLLLEEKKLKII